MATTLQPLPEHASLDGLDQGLLLAVAQGHARLTPEQALSVYRGLSLNELSRLADLRCRSLHGDSLRTYVIDRNINYTNVCNARCTFCAFRRDEGDHDAYTLSYEQIHEKIAQLSAIGGTQILMQGGMNPALPLEWYLKLLTSIRERFPHIHVHAFSPPEMIEFVHFFDPPGRTLAEKIRWVLVRLKDAGLQSLPGGGGEIFAPAVRRKIGLGKCDADAWLTTMHVAHTLGMFTSATMMFGHIEAPADRVHHMLLVRQWQDIALGRSVTRAVAGGPHENLLPREGPLGHYVAFISWPFQRENTPLGRVPDWGQDPAELAGTDGAVFPAEAFSTVDGRGDPADLPESHHARRTFGRRVRMSGATDYLRTQALSRLMLDNVYSIGSSWVTMGPHIGQVGLTAGANDMGSVMMEENVVSSAGTTYCLDEAVLCRLVRDAGFVPAQRNNTYDILRTHHDAVLSPDGRVTDWSQHRARAMHQQAAREPKVAVTVGGRA
ncbi:MAG: radical SAM protein [Phycisphaerales bacterium]